METSWRDRVTAAEIREVWAGQVAPVDPTLLGPEIPAGTRDFLVTVGLPTASSVDMTRVRDAQLAAPVDHDGGRYLLVFEGAPFAEGHDPNYWYGVDLASERVRLLNDDPRWDRWVNTSLAVCVYVLGIYRNEYWDSETGETDSLVVGRIYAELSDRDPVAIENERDWLWFDVLDRMFSG